MIQQNGFTELKTIKKKTCTEQVHHRVWTEV